MRNREDPRMLRLCGYAGAERGLGVKGSRVLKNVVHWNHRTLEPFFQYISKVILLSYFLKNHTFVVLSLTSFNGMLQVRGHEMNFKDNMNIMFTKKINTKSIEWKDR
jgi:hypothetical protein